MLSVESCLVKRRHVSIKKKERPQDRVLTSFSGKASRRSFESEFSRDRVHFQEEGEVCAKSWDLVRVLCLAFRLCGIVGNGRR